MSCSRLHRENRFTGILNKLIQNLFRIIIFPTFKSRERTYTNHITIRSHYRNSLQQMLTLVTIHNHATLCFQFPGTLIHIQHNDIHTQITGCLLRAQTRTQTVIKENKQTSLMLAQRFIFITVVLDFKRFCQGSLQIAQIEYIGISSHTQNCILIYFSSQIYYKNTIHRLFYSFFSYLTVTFHNPLVGSHLP